MQTFSSSYAQVAQLLLLALPLLVAVAVLVLIVNWSHRAYTTVYRRTNPPSTYEERKEYRLYFRVALIGGMAFLGAALYWWMLAHKPPRYVFQGVIVGLEKTQTLLAQEEGLYARPVFRETGKGHQVVDYQFVIVRDAPFYAGQSFALGLFPEAGSLGKARPEALALSFEYRGNDQEQLTLIREAGNYRLIPVTGGQP